MRTEPQYPFAEPPHALAPRPYAPTGAVMTLPGELPAAVAYALGPGDGAGVEGGGLLYGRRGSNGDADVVWALVLPCQRRHRQNYRISRDGIAEASAATREHGWVALGQVHTHPGRHVEHSWYDDRNAISAKALSFVVPHYGADPGQWLVGVGVHEFQIDWWHLLEPTQARARVEFADVPLTTLDLRR